jgi:hypothetical protein
MFALVRQLGGAVVALEGFGCMDCGGTLGMARWRHIVSLILRAVARELFLRISGTIR